MVEMQMADDHRVDVAIKLGGECRHRAAEDVHPVEEHRVRQDANAAHLDQHGRVAQEGDLGSHVRADASNCCGIGPAR